MFVTRLTQCQHVPYFYPWQAPLLSHLFRNIHMFVQTIHGSLHFCQMYSARNIHICDNAIHATLVFLAHFKRNMYICRNLTENVTPLMTFAEISEVHPCESSFWLFFYRNIIVSENVVIGRILC